MEDSIDNSFKKFKEKILNFDINKLSEADTRCKLIDKLFIECLDWEEDNITREENINTGYMDYIFKVDNYPLFILEAKKGATNFELSTELQKREYKLSGIISKNKNLMDAIEQVHKYCTEKGVKIGIVSNGHQYLIFDAMKVGSPWREGKCIVFSSLEDIEKNFNSFYRFLNKNSVIGGKLNNIISGDSSNATFSRPLNAISNRNAILNRNTLYSYISPFIPFIFGDITEENQLNILSECYVFNKSQNAGKSLKKIFEERMPAHVKDEDITKVLEEENGGGLLQNTVEYVDLNGKGELILLLGGVGTGKTTFIHRLFNIILKNKDKHYWFYVDFKVAPTEKDSIEKFIFDKLAMNYKKKYEKSIDLKLKEKGVNIDKNTNPEDFFQTLFSILKLLGNTVTIVMDNVDKCESQVQEKIFLSSNYITDKYSVLTILSLREESYYKSKLTGVFDAYHIKKFTIIPPTLEKMIFKRIDYLIDFIKTPDSEISKIMGKKINFLNRKKDILKFFETIRYSLARRDPMYPSSTITFISSISDGNMREGLDMFNNYLSSGNTKVNAILENENPEKFYLIQEYHFLKSIILPDSKFYNEEKSKIMNMFDVDITLSNSHFLHLRILNYLFLNKSNKGKDGPGYISIQSIIEEGRKLFITEESIISSLKKLAKFNLIKFDTEDKINIEISSSMKITATGTYYLTLLIRKSIYIDIIKFDTQITSKTLSKKIKTHSEEESMAIRLDLCSKFLNYLDWSEKNEFQSNPNFLNSNLTRRRFIPPIIEVFEREKNYILKKRARSNTEIKNSFQENMKEN